MIYHNYSPYYYSAPTRLNRKHSNISNNSTSYLNNNNHYVPTSYNKNFHKNARKNNRNLTTINQQTIEKKEERTFQQKEIPHKSNNDVVFEIFGIKLFFDDILLICLIFFLYNEGVQDQYLFIALVLLLLS